MTTMARALRYTGARAAAPTGSPRGMQESITT